MQTKEVTTVEVKSSLDEVNNILIAHIQKQFGVKIENVSVDKEGIVTFSGVKSKDITSPELQHNGANGADLASSIFGGKKGRGEKRAYAPRKNSGLTVFLREQLKDGHKIPIDLLVAEANKNGFEANVSLIDKYLKQGTMKKDMVEVNKGVWQIREAFEKTHNRQAVAA